MSHGLRTVLVVPAPPKTLNQRTAKALLEADGWAQTTGGKHVVKMEKAGRRPITLPSNKRRYYPKGLTAAMLSKLVGTVRRKRSRCDINCVHHPSPRRGRGDVVG